MFQGAFETLVHWLAAVLFFNIGGFPFIVLWLVVAALFFTVYLRGVNFRLFRHALRIVSGHYDHKEDAGEVSHLQALLSALSATVGLGSIAGISVGIAIGGPGAIFWIVLAGLLKGIERAAITINAVPLIAGVKPSGNPEPVLSPVDRKPVGNCTNMMREEVGTGVETVE